MLLVRISDGQVGLLVGVFSQPLVRQSPATMVRGELVQPPPQHGTLVSGCVAVSDQFVLAPLGEITPIYEMPEEEEDAEAPPIPTERTFVREPPIGEGEPAVEAGDPPRETEGEGRPQA